MTPNLLKQVPEILRARGFRLYAKDGRRLIDLWQNGGAAVMGHTPPNILRELKNTASRGLYAPFPHFTEGRYLKALSKLFPGYSFRLYASAPQELVVKNFSEKISRGGAVEPTVRAQRGDRIRLWYPFADPEEPFKIEKDSSLIVPVLPGVQTWRDGLPVGLCVAAGKSEEALAHLPPGDMLPPVLLAAAARGLYDILASPQRAKPVLPRVSKALQNNSNWQREGIYLKLKDEPNNETWIALFKKFLDAGFLLSPNPLQPVILPGELSAGEDAKLAAVLK